jgi:hypothetical protein
MGIHDNQRFRLPFLAWIPQLPDTIEIVPPLMTCGILEGTGDVPH